MNYSYIALFHLFLLFQTFYKDVNPILQIICCINGIQRVIENGTVLFEFLINNNFGLANPNVNQDSYVVILRSIIVNEKHYCSGIARIDTTVYEERYLKIRGKLETNDQGHDVFDQYMMYVMNVRLVDRCHKMVKIYDVANPTVQFQLAFFFEADVDQFMPYIRQNQSELNAIISASDTATVQTSDQLRVNACGSSIEASSHLSEIEAIEIINVIENNLNCDADDTNDD